MLLPLTLKEGFLLAWQHGVDLVGCSLSANILSTWCYSDPPNNPWLLSCIYGPPMYKNKFWFGTLL
jgi:hypothetical protein